MALINYESAVNIALAFYSKGHPVEDACLFAFKRSGLDPDQFDMFYHAVVDRIVHRFNSAIA